MYASSDSECCTPAFAIVRAAHSARRLAIVRNILNSALLCCRLISCQQESMERYSEAFVNYPREGYDIAVIAGARYSK